MKANEIKEFVEKETAGDVAIIFNDSSVKIGHGMTESLGDGTGSPNLWELHAEGFHYIIDGNEMAYISRLAETPNFLARTKPTKTTYEIGDRIRLKDDGDTDYIIVSTKEMSVGNNGLGIFDYEIKKDCKKTEGVYIRKVFKENIYGV